MSTGHKARVSNGALETSAAIALHLGEWKIAIAHHVCELWGKNCPTNKILNLGGKNRNKQVKLA